MVDSKISNEKTNDRPIIVCAADDNYAMPLAVTMCSVLKNLKSYQHVHLFVLDGGISDHNKNLVRKSLDPNKVTTDWVPISNDLVNQLCGLGPSAHYNYTIYLRFLIPKLIPSTISKVIYLDCDLIVKNDIGKLWNMDMGDHIFLAVQDSYIPKLADRSQVINWKKCGATQDTKYFNTGVLVINCHQWLHEDVAGKAIGFIRNNERKLQFSDQDALNAVMFDKWGEIDQKWNCILISDDDDKKLIDDSYILHLGSNKKPWHCGSKKPTRKIFYEYLDMTAWAGWRPKATSRQKTKELVQEVLKWTFPIREKLGLTGWHIRKQQFKSKLRSTSIKKKYDLNESLEYRDDLPGLLIALGLNGEGVEIGVWKGDFSQKTLYNSYLSVLYSVDPWKKFNDDEYIDTFNENQSNQDYYYNFTVSALKKFRGRSKVLRMTSTEAVRKFENNRLDFVYIDAQHSYRACQEDIRLWWPKVKKGGILSGHDYVNGNLPEGDFGVKKAVDEFANQENLKLFVTNEEWPTWYVVKD